MNRNEMLHDINDLKEGSIERKENITNDLKLGPYIGQLRNLRKALNNLIDKDYMNTIEL